MILMNTLQTTSDLFDIDENDYAPYAQSYNNSPAPTTYPQSFGSLAPTYNSITLNDPFHGPTLSTIEESAQQHFHELSLRSRSYSESLQLPASSESSPSHYAHSRSLHLRTVPEPRIITAPDSCSVCGRTSALAILEPCLHPLCSACLTSALNIVGEKDMECAVCKRGVKDFKLGAVTGESNKESEVMRNEGESKERLLPSAFEGTGKWNGSGFVTSTPVRHGTPKCAENVVLRIDNVPWVSPSLFLLCILD
jgi:hypothetical protein